MPLFRDDAGHEEFARVNARSAVEVLQRFGAFAHVSGRGNFYGYDGWVHSEDLTNDKPFGLIGLIGKSSDENLRPRNGAVEVRLKADRTAPAVMTLAPEAVVRERSRDGDFLGVEIAGLAFAEPRYYVLSTELEPVREAAAHE